MTDLDIRKNVTLGPYTTLDLGGPARYFVECRTEVSVRDALVFGLKHHLPTTILGGGSNVVFPDAGFPGLVVRIAIGGIEFRDGATPEILAGAGVEWDNVVGQAVERGWTGIECLSGIPGTVGGTPIQNVGAYGQEVAETLVSVTCLDRTTGERWVFAADECDFGYRSSRFKGRDRGRYVLLEVTLRLQRDTPSHLRYSELKDAVAQASSLSAVAPIEQPRLVRDTVLALRRKKSMVLDPADPNARSVGSFFLNPVLSTYAFTELQQRWDVSGRGGPIPSYPARGGVKVPAAWLVEQAGFAKGYRRGGVGISSRHVLALVNHSGTTAELLALAEAVAGAVYDQFGIRLEPEPEIVRTVPGTADLPWRPSRTWRT